MNPFDSKSTVGILVEHIDQPSTVEEAEVMVIDPFNRRSPINDYLKSPLAAMDSQLVKIRIKAAKYTLIDDILYKKSFTL